MKNRVTKPGLEIMNNKKIKCQHCGKEFSLGNIKRHEHSCYLNPKNLTLCKVCENPIKNYKTSKGTCSHSCSNKYFVHLRNKPENYSNYQTICFKTHGKKCIKCGEEKIVTVHHYDLNHNNNDPNNLVPLCPTHHQYLHSRYADEVQPIVDEFIKNLSL